VQKVSEMNIALAKLSESPSGNKKEKKRGDGKAF